jgi:hypothetical protein
VKKLFVLLFCFQCLSFLSAQSVYFGTGDAAFDAQLNDLNVSAKSDAGAFHASVSAEFKIPRAQVQMAVDAGMQPAEVYLAAEFAAASRQPMPKIIKLWKAHRGKGWGVVARELNIKTGSREFRGMKDHVRVRTDKFKTKQAPYKPQKK